LKACKKYARLKYELPCKQQRNGVVGTLCGDVTGKEEIYQSATSVNNYL